MRYKSFLILLLTIVSVLINSGRAYAQVEALKTDVTHTFGDTIQFRADVVSTSPIKAAIIFFQADGDTRTNLGLAEVETHGFRRFDLTYVHSIEDYSFRPFSVVRFHWELTFQTGETYTSPVEFFVYTDNRFDWQVLKEKNLSAHWYDGDLQFAQEILDIAQDGLQKIQNLLPVPEAGAIQIYTYADSASLQSALNTGGESWVAGHADPDLGVILIALPKSPEQLLLARQRIPHELMHVLLYRDVGSGYFNLPVWLREGLSSGAELYPNPDYQILLDESVAQGRLLPMRSLCDAFPREASSALLSYAEAQSFTNYLHDRFGASGLEALITAYANGMDCESGAERALGKNLSQLERDWQREALSQNVALKAFQNLLPWGVLLLAVLAVPLILALLNLRGSSL